MHACARARVHALGGRRAVMHRCGGSAVAVVSLLCRGVSASWSWWWSTCLAVAVVMWHRVRPDTTVSVDRRGLTHPTQRLGPPGGGARTSRRRQGEGSSSRSRGDGGRERDVEPSYQPVERRFVTAVRHASRFARRAARRRHALDRQRPEQYTASWRRSPPANVIWPHSGQVSSLIMPVSPVHSASASIIASVMIRSDACRARYACARHTSSQYRRLVDALLGNRAPQEAQNRIRATPSGSLAAPACSWCSSSCSCSARAEDGGRAARRRQERPGRRSGPRRPAEPVRVLNQ